MTPCYLMLYWHMHQPFYKDLVEDNYAMPWVRMHALKDYYGMVAILREFPNVHVTFNLVPSLVAQIEDYATDQARDEAYGLAFKAVDKFKPEEREKLLDYAFQINRENLLFRFPRFRELFERAETVGRAIAAQRLAPQDIRDLQVLSQLAWFDETYLAADPAVGALVARGRGYTRADKVLLRKKEIELFQATLQEYRAASERGQVELSTSPFYHPILPLLCDTDVAGESRSGIRLPRCRFRHPEDARDQLRAAVQLHERIFGRRPMGLWPSEGSVSDRVLKLAAAEGFEWTATDEGVLGRSLQIGFYRNPDGTLWGGNELYRPHQFQSGEDRISIFFRDHELSDLIGFVYSRLDPDTAAADLHRRIRAAARSTGPAPAVVSVILDGENCWESYPGNGREFLRRFYRRVAEDPELHAVTASEALRVTTPGQLTHIVPGSWINANFDIWIGAEEDNLAWDYLAQARDFFAARAARPDADPEKVKLAQQELFIAEGSDWCWWYGPEHSTANDAEFDRLYRTHLSNIYRLLGGLPPDELAAPIKRLRFRALHVAPTGRIDPCIDGRVTNYFEWLGAGVYSPDTHSGSMHGAAQYIEALYYGTSHQALALRLDLTEEFLREHRDFEVRVNVTGHSPARVHAAVRAGRVGAIDFWEQERAFTVPAETGDQVQVAFERIVEARLGFNLLGVGPHDQVRLQVSLWVNELPVQVVPTEGWLTLELTDEPVAW